MKKIFVIYIICIVHSLALQAQQSPLYSLYMMNDFAVNPAVAGTEDNFKAQINNRYQFAGIENAPVTATIALHGGLKSLPMGWGGLVYNDSQGAFTKFGVYGAYSYIIPIDKRTKFSMGLNIGVVQYKVDLTKILFLQEEPNLDVTVYENIRPDATFGAYIKSKDYYGGLSIDQLFNNKIELINDSLVTDNTMINRLKSHASIMGGYRHKMSYGFDFEPSAVVRIAGSAPLQLELTARVTYQKIAWTGVSFRTGDAVTLLLGYNYRKSILFAYAYDITYSRLRKDSAGSHEIMMAIKFNEKE